MWLYFVVKWHLFCEQLRVRKLYYGDRWFRKLDRALLRAYRFKNPYSISRRFLQARGGKEVHVYGETTLTTYEKIGRECGLSSRDRVLEMGCGRGRGVFFWHTDLERGFMVLSGFPSL